MWDLEDRLNYVLFEQALDIEPFRRGETVGTKVGEEEKTGTYLGMSGDGKARVRVKDVVYKVDPKILYIPAEERKREKRRARQKVYRAKKKAEAEEQQEQEQQEQEQQKPLRDDQLDEVEDRFRLWATHPKSTPFERAYFERMLELFDKGITREEVKGLIRAAKKERLRQHSYEKRGDRTAMPKYKALERAIFHF